MSTIDTVVIGAGHAGLAVSRLLTDAGHDHLVLDRGRVGETWRTERWDSLHLLTPSWMTRLPLWEYAGDDQDGYLSVGEFVDHLEAYAASFPVPLRGGTTVEDVRVSRHDPGRYVVATDRGTWHTDNVVIATGPHGLPHLPAGLSRSEVVTASEYRNPAQLADGGVLVVGASASGAQIADELSRAGREVTLAVGRHTRVPRRYRGLDILWWLDVTGHLARTIDEMPDPVAARRESSLQLVGRSQSDRATGDLDLGLLQSQGVRLVGGLAAMSGQVAQFRDDLEENVALAEAGMHRLLHSIDEYIDRAYLTQEVWPGTRPPMVEVATPPSRLDLRAEGIGTILVAAGYRRPQHHWLRLPVHDLDGSIRQHRGVTPAPGVYTVGQRFQHRRDSGMIGGARHDARMVVDHLLGRDAAVVGASNQGTLA
ncbi:MAG: pyridine nucleotide-disulfide oxidoreductase [Marmoricola sp.]|nr:pyridine nucleotide-disulfide oxidoreductase [Marmoricola sp.]